MAENELEEMEWTSDFCQYMSSSSGSPEFRAEIDARVKALRDETNRWWRERERERRTLEAMAVDQDRTV
jgi:hypothetical protein